MNEHDRNERLKLGRKLRESTTLTECRAYIRYDDGLNPEWQKADIPPGAINPEGYVEEVWIAPEEMSIDKVEVNGEVHLVLFPGWLTDTRAKVESFEVFENEPYLLPSPNLSIRYRIDNLKI